MNKIFLFLQIWVVTTCGYAQDTLTLKQQGEILKEAFGESGAVIFEGTFIEQINYRQSGESFSMLKVDVTKSFHKDVSCGIQSIKISELTSGAVMDLDSGGRAPRYILIADGLYVYGYGVFRLYKSDSHCVISRFLRVIEESGAGQLNPGTRAIKQITDWRQVYKAIRNKPTCVAKRQ